MASCCYVASTPRLNAAAAFFHAVQAVIVFGLIGWLNTQPHGSAKFRVDKFINTWHKFENTTEMQSMIKNRAAMNSDFYVETKVLDAGSLDVRYIIAFFFALSAGFQTWGSYVMNPKTVFRLRFIEYSFSASIMMLAIAVEAGIRDIYTLEMMFVLIWVTMILGILADFMSDITLYLNASVYDEEPVMNLLGCWAWLIPHAAGWATCCSAYIPVIDMFTESSKHSETQAPGFVHVIIHLQFALFSCFGFVQLYYLVMRTVIITNNSMATETEMLLMNTEQFIGNIDSRMRAMYGSDPRKMRLAVVADNAERAYIALSFIAKTLLAWLILSPLIASSA